VRETKEHPEDFGPYLQGEASDPKFQEVRAHAEECARCQDEVRMWKSVDELFRSPESEIPVPPFQWQRIQARMQASAPAGLAGRLPLVFRRWKPAWSGALVTLALGTMIVTGIGIRKSLEERQLLLAITQYAQEESRRIAADENPFRVPTGSEQGPFDRSLFSDLQVSPTGRR
jgi:anti-sigma factor RsiW